MTKKRYVFVVENVLGHVTHGMNIERVLETRDDVDGAVIRISVGRNPGVTAVPVVKNWSVQASWAARQSLRRELQQRPADAFFVHTQVAALFLRSIMHDVPTIVSLDATPINFDTMAEAYGHDLNAAPIERFKRAVNRRALMSGKAVVTWSRWAASSVVDDYGIPRDRVHVIPPGVDVTRFTPRDGSRSEGPIRILFVGGDFERKGGTDLLAALSEIGTPVEVDVVSPAPGISVPAGATVRIHDCVDANSAAMVELYRDADVFALPTHGDCTPLAVAEALASGLPIVASDVGSMPDMVVEGENGYLVPPRDPRALGSALARLVRDDELRATMGESSRRLAEREHDTAANCARIIDLLDQISGDNRARSRQGAA